VSRVTGRAGLRPWPAVLVGGALATVNLSTGDGTKDNVPPISALFDATTAPALGEDLGYSVSSGFVEVDYRQPRNARRGGWYRLDVSRYADRDDGEWSFTQMDLDLRQFFGFVADRRVVALRAWLSSTTTADDSRGTPFFLLPSLGGHDTLRGFRNDRFRGPHALLLQAEYRWEVWSGLDAAIFYDAGQVAARRSDFQLSRLEGDYGVGFRFNTSNGIILRVDAAFGSTDGKHLYVSLGSVF
jgi:outer membrane protein assembly factor BamA